MLLKKTSSFGGETCAIIVSLRSQRLRHNNGSASKVELLHGLLPKFLLHFLPLCCMYDSWETKSVSGPKFPSTLLNHTRRNIRLNSPVSDITPMAFRPLHRNSIDI